jgi:hypothetical protein
MHGRTVIAILFLLVATPVFAQQQPQALPTDANQVQTLLERTGCNAEVSAASNTIAQQQKQIQDLQKQLAAKDPPPKSKSGATLH